MHEYSDLPLKETTPSAFQSLSLIAQIRLECSIWSISFCFFCFLPRITNTKYEDLTCKFVHFHVFLRDGILGWLKQRNVKNWMYLHPLRWP